MVHFDHELMELDCRKTLFRKIKLFSHKKRRRLNCESLDNMGMSLSRLIDLKDTEVDGLRLITRSYSFPFF